MVVADYWPDYSRAIASCPSCTESPRLGGKALFFVWLVYWWVAFPPFPFLAFIHVHMPMSCWASLIGFRLLFIYTYIHACAYVCGMCHICIRIICTSSDGLGRQAAFRLW